jgi:hypothetical protein
MTEHAEDDPMRALVYSADHVARWFVRGMLRVCLLSHTISRFQRTSRHYRQHLGKMAESESWKLGNDGDDEEEEEVSEDVRCVLHSIHCT